MTKKTRYVKVKICGITNAQDAEMAVRFGADALGFVFAPSPRRVNVKAVKKIVRNIGPYVARVGVFVNETSEKIVDIMFQCQLDAIQLHGYEHPRICTELNAYKLIKVFHVDEEFKTSETERYPVDAYMLETKTEGYGGSGKVWNWEGLAKKKFKRPLIVTGGLKPNNVRKVIEILKPYGVDVSSGVESRPGKKNHKLMEEFIRNAKRPI